MHACMHSCTPPVSGFCVALRYQHWNCEDMDDPARWREARGPQVSLRPRIRMRPCMHNARMRACSGLCMRSRMLCRSHCSHVYARVACTVCMFEYGRCMYLPFMHSSVGHVQAITLAYMQLPTLMHVHAPICQSQPSVESFKYMHLSHFHSYTHVFTMHASARICTLAAQACL